MKPLDLLWFLWFAVLTLGPIILQPILQPIVPASVLPLVQVIVSGGWLGMLFKMLYDRWDRFYFFANRVWLWLTQDPIALDFSAEFGVGDRTDALNIAWDTIKTHFPDAKPRNHTDRGLVVRLERYSVFLSRHAEIVEPSIVTEPRNALLIEISDFTQPYRTGSRILENEIFPLLEWLKEALAPTDQKYQMKLIFERANPYFGLFVRKLHLPQVISFNCQFVDAKSTGQRETVTVNKDKLTIVTEQISSLQSLTRKYISLSDVA